jgi:hypothetical protein
MRFVVVADDVFRSELARGVAISGLYNLPDLVSEIELLVLVFLGLGCEVTVLV